MPRELKRALVSHLILHRSDSGWGDVGVISEWHRKRGFEFVGGTFAAYHYVILNGYRSYAQLKDGRRVPEDDGAVQVARPDCYQGPHALGFNANSLGICLIGVASFTPRQFEALRELVRKLMAEFRVPVEHVLGHDETPLVGDKVCPNFDVGAFRRSLVSQEA